MKKIILFFSVLVLLAASGQAQRHYVARGRGGYGGGYHYARPYYGGYGRSYLGFGLGLGLGLGFYANPYPYYGYAYPPQYGYGNPYAYPPGYAPPPPQYQYDNPPAYDSTGRAPQQNYPNKDGGYNQYPQQGDGPVADNSNTQGPKPTKAWIDSHWERRSSGWVWVEGYWKYN